MQSHVTGGDCTKWRSFALFKKSRQNHRFYIWTEALSGMALSPVYPIIWTLNLSLGHLAFLSRYLSRGPLSVYFDYMSELCWLKTGRYVGSQLVNISSKQFSPCLFFFVVVFLCCVLKRGLISCPGYLCLFCTETAASHLTTTVDDLLRPRPDVELFMRRIPKL